MLRLIAAFFALTLLAGCAGFADEAADETITEARGINDALAKVEMNAPCGVGIGALQRGFNTTVQEHAWKLCTELNSVDAEAADFSDLADSP